jgi:amidohydrolase
MLTRAKQLAEQLILWRRDIHQHPELGFRETRTARLVAEVLESLGYEVRRGVGKTGVVGERGAGRPVVAIRADMDALPVVEESGVPYASRTPGVMHACGHDAHTAMALGAATLLAGVSLPGTVRLLFQPAEEMEDEEGLGGAQRLVQDGAMDGVEAVLALHVHGGLPVGQIAVDPGPVSAGVDSFWATVTGRGGHGAYPHKGLDPIHLAAHVVLALHGIVSRRVDPLAPAVLTVGAIHGGQANNVIPEKVEIAGTIRYQTSEIQARIHEEMERALSIARTLGGDYALRIRRGSPPVVNDGAVADLVEQVARGLLGPDAVRHGEKGMGAEDFAVLAALAPGTLFRLGCRIEGDERSIHNPTFDLDEACLPLGAALLAETALRLLGQGEARAAACIDKASHL